MVLGALVWLGLPGPEPAPAPLPPAAPAAPAALMEWHGVTVREPTPGGGILDVHELMWCYVTRTKHDVLKRLHERAPDGGHNIPLDATVGDYNQRCVGRDHDESDALRLTALLRAAGHDESGLAHAIRRSYEATRRIGSSAQR